MAAPEAAQGDEPEKREDEFQQTIRRIGGKENIYLVGEACKNDGEQRNSLLTFTNEMFNADSKHYPNSVIGSSNDNTRPDAENQNNTINYVADIGDVVLTSEDKDVKTPTTDGHEPTLNGDLKRVIRSSRNVSGAARLIDSALIIFIFRHEYINNNGNQVCIKEIMKDVKARTKHSPTVPAVIGLVHSADESRGALQSVQVLEGLLHSVFRKHFSDSIWAGLFIPNTVEKMMDIKKHVTKAVHSSLSSDNVTTNNLLWSLKCLSWWRQQRRSRGQPRTLSRSMETVEGIPLKSKPAVRGHQGDFANGIS